MGQEVAIRRDEPPCRPDSSTLRVSGGISRLLSRLSVGVIVLLSCATGGDSIAATLQFYGLIDTFVMYAHNGGASHFRMGSDSGVFERKYATATDSFWGLLGTEDLGDGVQVQFRLEGGVHMTNGATRYPDTLFNREANLAVGSASWGTLKLGRQYPAVVSHTADPFFFSEAFSPAASASQMMMDLGEGAARIQVRVNDAISYQTPSMNGLVIHALYAPQQRKKLFAMNGDNASGPTEGDTGALATYTSGQWVLGGSYNALRSESLHGSFRTDLFVASTAYTTGALQSSIVYTLVRPKAPGTISAQIMTLNSLWQQGPHMLRGTLLYRALNGRSDHTIGGLLGYDYALSKRSSVYTRAGGFKNTSRAFYGLGASVPMQAGASSTVLALGIMHRF